MVMGAMETSWRRPITDRSGARPASAPETRRRRPPGGWGAGTILIMGLVGSLTGAALAAVFAGGSAGGPQEAGGVAAEPILKRLHDELVRLESVPPGRPAP